MDDDTGLLDSEGTGEGAKEKQFLGYEMNETGG